MHICRLREKTKIFDQKNEIEASKNEKEQDIMKGKRKSEARNPRTYRDWR